MQTPTPVQPRPSFNAAAFAAAPPLRRPRTTLSPASANTVTACAATPDPAATRPKAIARIVRSRAFVDRVIRHLDWPYVRYAGVLLPAGHRDLPRYRARPDTAVVDVPPGIISRATTSTSTSTSSSPNDPPEQWCAVFELYGQTTHALRAARDARRGQHEDISEQFASWADPRQTLRTETNLSDPNGPQLFHEDHMQYIE